MVRKKLSVPSVGDEQPITDKPVTKGRSSQNDATARCIEAKLNLLIGLSKIMAQVHIDRAQQLHMPGKEILSV